MRIVYLFLLSLSSFISYAQMPETRIYTLDINRGMRGKLEFSNPTLIGFKTGYNNQPYFTPDGKGLLFVANKGKGNTDIFEYKYKKKKSMRLTETKEAEYSPKWTITENEISCVRVEQDTVTQHFYAYNLKGGKGHSLSNTMTTLGYYQWLNSNEIIAFLVPEPFTFVKYNISTLRCDTLLTAPGRTFYNYKGKIYFVDKSDSTKYYIKTVAKENLRSRKNPAGPTPNPIVAQTLEGQEDFAIMNDGTIIMGKESKLYAYYPRRAKRKDDWAEIADFSKLGIGNFYRITLNQENNKLAIVVYEGKKP
jgi:hypothetical protein